MTDLTAISGRLEQYQVMTISDRIPLLFAAVKYILQNKGNTEVMVMTAFRKQTGYSLVVTQFVHQIINDHKISYRRVNHRF